ncbi:MAG: metallophosphoesterase family protein [Candidatus Hydrogenedentota bacterium]
MWRFAHITDPHLASTRDGEWNNRFLCSMMPQVMACLRRDLAQLQPEFILATGDIVSHQTRAAMFEARDLMESLGVPYYPMGGNHDFVVEESRDWFLEAFAHRLPAPRPYYAFNHKNLHFVVLDAWWLWSDDTLSAVSEQSVAENIEVSLAGARWAIPPFQLAWLDAHLTAHQDKPVIIGVHYPALGVPPHMKRPNYKDSGHLENGGLLIDLLSAHNRVRAIFSGHMHMNYITQASGIVQVVTSALPEFPVEYRDVRVYQDRLEIETRPLSDPTFTARSLKPGREWTRGTPDDRTRTIPL